MIAAVQVDVRRDELDDAVKALRLLQKKVGTVNAEVLQKIVNENKHSKEYINDDTIDPLTLQRTSYEIFRNLDWKSIQPKYKKLDWKHVGKILPEDVDTEFFEISDKTDGGTDGELRSIAGFLLEEELGLYAPYLSKDQLERPITQQEIDDIVLDKKLKREIKDQNEQEKRAKQLKILKDVNQFVWEQKPRSQKSVRPPLKDKFKTFLRNIMSQQQINSKMYKPGLARFRTKYANAKGPRNDRLKQNKEVFLKKGQAAGCVLTDESANRVMALVVERIVSATRELRKKQ
jgi:hypothetical protein